MDRFLATCRVKLQRFNRDIPSPLQITAEGILMLESESRPAENVVAPPFRIATGKRYSFIMMHSGSTGAKSDVIYLGSSTHDEVILVQKTVCKDFKRKAGKKLQNLKLNIPDMALPSPCLMCSKLRRANEMCAFKCTCHP